MTPGATTAELPLPRRHLPARLGQNEPAELVNHADVFGDRNELGRTDRASCRMIPARQRLEPLDRPRAQRKNRLVEHRQLAVVDGILQIGLDLQARHRPLPHGRVEQLERRVGRLRAVQRDRRILQQLLRLHVSGRAQRDADRRGREDLASVDVERARSAARRRSATRIASLASVMSSSSTVNSSPPSRASVNPALSRETMSVPRSLACRRRATETSS